MLFRIIPRRSVNLTLGIFGKFVFDLIKGKAFGGLYYENFRKRFSGYIGVKNTIGVYSGRAGFYLILKVLQLKKGDEIIMPAYNFHLLPIITEAVGAVPKFVEINPATYNIDASAIEKKITSKTKAILVVHMSGLPCDLESILDVARRNNLKVIEDCAQSLGSEYKGKKVGVFGDASLFSFDFNKNMPCFLGGMVAIKDDETFKRVKNLLNKYFFSDWLSFFHNVFTNLVLFFIMKKQLFPFVTYPLLRLLALFDNNYIDSLTHSEVIPLRIVPAMYHLPLNNLQAGVGSEQLNRLEETNHKTRSNAYILNEELKGIEGVSIPLSSPESRHIYLYYRLAVRERSLFRKKLLQKGIDCLPSCMLACPEIEFLKTDNEEYPNTLRAAQCTLEIPNGPFLKEKDMLYIAEKIKEVNAELNQKD